MHLMKRFSSKLRSTLALGVALGSCLFAVGAAQAVTITAAGSNVNLGSGWRTSSVVKNDIDGNNVLGSDGYRIVGTNARSLTPSYIGLITQSGNIFGGNGGYASIDDPNTTPGGGPTTMGSGTTNPFAGVNVEASVFTFSVHPGAPSTFRVAVLNDNTDGTQFASNSIRIAQTVGGAATSATVNTSTLNRVSDWYYFDVVGAQAGDTFSVLSGGGASGCNCLGGIAFDSLGGPAPANNPTKLWSVDIQGTGGTLMTGSEATYGAGNVWNAFNITPHPSAVVNPQLNLVSSNGAASPVNFKINGTVSAFNNAGTLTQDYLFIGAGNVTSVNTIGWEITGLEAGGLYEMFVYGGSIGGRDFLMTIDLDGDGLLSDQVGVNVGTSGTFFGSILAGAGGRIIGSAFRASGEANWAGFQLRQLSSPIPEPTTIGLLAAGVLGLGLRRRRVA